MFGAKAEIAAHEKGLAFELIMVPFEMKTLYQPKHPEVLRINPKRQVPVLIDGDLEIFDSTQIFEYIEFDQARARSVAARSQGTRPRPAAGAQVRRGLFPADRPPHGLAGHA